MNHIKIKWDQIKSINGLEGALPTNIGMLDLHNFCLFDTFDFNAQKKKIVIKLIHDLSDTDPELVNVKSIEIVFEGVKKYDVKIDENYPFKNELNRVLNDLALLKIPSKNGLINCCFETNFIEVNIKATSLKILLGNKRGQI